LTYIMSFIDFIERRIYIDLITILTSTEVCVE